MRGLLRLSPTVEPVSRRRLAPDIRAALSGDGERSRHAESRGLLKSQLLENMSST
jgi:hypothetical protein